MGVTRQIEDCERLAERRGWAVVETLRRRRRERLEREAAAGVRADARRSAGGRDRRRARLRTSTGCTGSRRELEAFIDVCEELRRRRPGVGDAARSTLPTPDGQFQARILGAVAKKESDDKSRRIRRKHEEIAANGKVSGGGSRPYGYEADKVTVRPAEAAVVAECAKRSACGRVGALDRARSERARGADGDAAGSGRRRACADARLAADQRPARPQRRDRRDGGLARDHQRRGRSARSGRCSRTRSGARTRRRAATCSAACLSVATAASGWSRGPARRSAPLCLRERRRASPAAARPTSTPTTSSGSSPRPSCTGSTRRELQRAWSGGSAAHPDARALAGRRAEAAQAQLDELAAAYGERRDLDGRVDAPPASRSSSA